MSVPPGAVSTATYVSFEAGTNVEQFRLMAVGPPIHIDTGGARFAAPVTVEVPFDPSLLAASYPGATPADIYVLKRSDGDATVLRLTPTSFDEARSVVRVQVSSFSTFQAAVPVPARYVYVTNFDDGTISFYSVDNATGRLRARGYAYIGAGANPDPITVNPASTLLLEGNFSANTLLAFGIQPNGFLGSQAGSAATGNGPVWIASAPPGKASYVYTADFMDSTLAAFSFTSAGALAPLPGGPYSSQWIPEGIAVHPTGIGGTNFLYVPNYSTATIDARRIEANGALTLLQSLASPAPGPIAVALEPTGRFAYVANWDDGTVSTYSVQQSGAAAGTLSFAAKTTATPAVVNPIGITTDIYGSFVVTANFGTNNVSSFAIQANGTLALADSKPVGAGPGASLGKQGAGGGANAIQKDPFGKYVYVIDQVTNELASFSLTPAGQPGAGTLAPVGVTRTQTTPTELTVTTGAAGVAYTSKYAYALTANGGQIAAYSVSPSGALASTGQTYDPGNFPLGLCIDPTQRYLLAASLQDGTVRSWAISLSNGSLTPMSNLQLSAGLTSVVIEPSGRFAFALNGVARTISVLRIAPGGVLSLESTVTGVGTGGAISLAIEPAGRFLYVADGGTRTTNPPLQVSVSAYRIDPAAGGLTFVASAPTNTSGGALLGVPGLDVIGLAVDSTGRFLYVPSVGSNAISVFTIDATTGALGFVTNLTGSGLSAPAAITAHPAKDVIYVTNAEGPNGNKVLAFKVDAATGNLSPLGSAQATDANPIGVSVDLSGQFVYAVSFFGQTVTQLKVNADGSLAANGSANIDQGGVALAVAGIVQ